MSQPASVFDDVEPWPERKAAPAPKDHNRPPPEEIIPVEFREGLLEQNADFFTLLDRYLGRLGMIDGEGDDEPITGVVDRAYCNDDASLGKCGETIKALRALEQIVNSTHEAVKKPYLVSGRLADAEKNALVARIAEGRAKVQRVMDDYADQQLAARRKREAEEAAERKRLEDLARENNLEQALPPPPPPPPRSEPVRSDGGATVSIGTEWLCQVEDYAKAFKKVKDDAKVREAIDAAIKRIVKATKGSAIPGVRIWEAAKTSAR